MNDLTYCPPAYQVAAAEVKTLTAARWTMGGAQCRTLMVNRNDSGILSKIRDTGWLADETLEDLITYVMAHDKSSPALWILPDTSEMREFTHAWLQVQAGALVMASERGETSFTAHELSAGKHVASELAGLVVQRRGGGVPVSVFFTWVGSTWPAHLLGQLGTGDKELWQWLAGVNIASTALNCQTRFSPSYMGMTMLRQHVAKLERNGGKYRKPGPLPRPSAAVRDQVAAKSAHYLTWRRSIAGAIEQLDLHDTDAWAGYIPLYCYDRNSSFVSSAREVPIGEPRQVAGFIPGRPGLYHIASAGPTKAMRYDGLIPGPIWSPGERGWDPAGVEDVWAWEPSIRRALARGWHMTVDAGYCWPDPGDLVDLRAWNDRMWAARREAHEMARMIDGAQLSSAWSPATKIAERIIKAAGVAGVGRLNQTQGRAVMRVSRARETGAEVIARHTDSVGEWTGYADVISGLGREDMYWPEWWSTTIDSAGEAVNRAIETFAPLDTILAYVDQFYTLRKHAELEVDSWDKPGGWKLSSTVWLPLDQVEKLDQLTTYALVVSIGAMTGLEAVAQYDEQ